MVGVSDTRRPSPAEWAAWAISAAMAAEVYGVDAREVIDCRGRATRAHQGTALLDARRAAFYLANVGANLSLRALKRASGVASRDTLRGHIAYIEDAREVRRDLDALFDELAERLAVPGLGRAAA